MPSTVEMSRGIQTEKSWNQNKKILRKSKHFYETYISSIDSITLAKSVVFHLAFNVDCCIFSLDI